MRIKMDTKPFKDYIKNTKKLLATLNGMSKSELNQITDRHLARIKKNTAVGDSPDSPNLVQGWDRSAVVQTADGVMTETVNNQKHAPYYEYGHRQTPDRLVFIELKAGQSKYGRAAREVKSGKHRGKWGIYIRLKKSFVKGRFVMTDSETKAQQELDAAVKRIDATIKKGMG